MNCGIKDIKPLQPGHMVYISDGKIEIKKYHGDLKVNKDRIAFDGNVKSINIFGSKKISISV